MNKDGAAVKPQKILVYDLGGGTFDVTVMEIAGASFTALATDGDVRLGGQDWDQRIVDCVAEEFMRQHGVDPREDANAAGRLWRECEDAKRTLSLRSKATVAYDFKGNTVRVENHAREVRRNHARSARPHPPLHHQANAASRRAAIGAQIDRVLLVGGLRPACRWCAGMLGRAVAASEPGRIRLGR